MAKRKQLSKRIRFEVLKRDGFRCRYCGATPIEQLLVVDHVIPVAKGGTNDPANLVTACCECNGGKSDVPLTESKVRPGRSPTDLHEQAEQIAEYLDACRTLVSAQQRFRDRCSAFWLERTGQDWCDQAFVTRLVNVVNQHGWDMLVECTEIVARHSLRGERSQAYFNGVLRKKLADSQTGPH